MESSDSGFGKQHFLGASCLVLEDVVGCWLLGWLISPLWIFDAPSDISFWGTRKTSWVVSLLDRKSEKCLCLQLIVDPQQKILQQPTIDCGSRKVTGDTPLGWWQISSIYCKKQWSVKTVISCYVPPLPPKRLAVSVLQDMTNIDKPPTN